MNFVTKNRQRGFTLIELALTIVIIAVGLFGMMVLFDNVTRGAMEGDLNIISVYLGREKMERIVFDKVNGGYNYVSMVNYPASENVSVGNNNFIRDLSIYEVSKQDLMTPISSSGFKRVDVMVRWGTGPLQRVTLSTVLTNY